MPVQTGLVEDKLWKRTRIIRGVHSSGSLKHITLKVRGMGGTMHFNCEVGIDGKFELGVCHILRAPGS
jgi:hypothetical protein